MVGDPHGPSSKSTLSAPPAHLELAASEEDILRLWARNEVVGRSLRSGAQTGSDAGKTFVGGMMDTTLAEGVYRGLSEAA